MNALFYSYKSANQLETLNSQLKAKRDEREIAGYLSQAAKLFNGEKASAPHTVLRVVTPAAEKFLSGLQAALDIKRVKTEELCVLYYACARSKIGKPDFFLSIESQLCQHQGEQLKPASLGRIFNSLSIIYPILKSPQKRLVDKQLLSVKENSDMYLNGSHLYVSILHCVCKFNYGASIMPELAARMENIEAQLMSGDPQQRKIDSLIVLYTSFMRLKHSPTFIREKIYPKIIEYLPELNPKHTLNLLHCAAEPKIFDSDICELLLKRVESMKPNSFGDRDKTLDAARLKIQLMRTKPIC